MIHSELDVLFPELQPQNGALFSPCRVWRYSLWRLWERDDPYLAVIGLNPSTADEKKNDPTIGRCINFAQDWGFGGLYMLNLFAFRATKPEEMKKAKDPIGPENNDIIVRICKKAGLVLVAWGVNGSYRNRDMRVLRLLEERPCCLGITEGGFPRHPLYVPNQQERVPYIKRKG